MAAAMASRRDETFVMVGLDWDVNMFVLSVFYSRCIQPSSTRASCGLRLRASTQG